MALVAAYLAGLLFALGLGIAGMTRPSKVLGFLDVAGAWDPTLAFVMGGALALTIPLYRFILRRPAPLFAAGFRLPTRRAVDPRLVGGASLFGVGWGLAGYCPGPALVGLVSGSPYPVVFCATMAVGFYLARLLEPRPSPDAGPDARPDPG
jgi:hypothetical protein